MTQQTITEEGAFNRTQRTQINDNFTELYAAIGEGSGSLTVTNLVVEGTTTLEDDVTIEDGKGIQTTTTTANTVKFNAYDVNGTAYKTFATLTSGDTPSFAIVAPSGGTVAIDGASIGAVTPGSGAFTTLSTTGVFSQEGGAVFNDASADVDFRVESNGNANAIFVDAGNDRVGIFTASPTVPLDVTGAILGSTTITAGTTVTAGTYVLGSVGNALTAAGTDRATALQLAKQVNNVTTAAASTGVVLPVGAIGMEITLVNNGAETLQVYASASETINGTAGATGITLAATKFAKYWFTAADTWISVTIN